MKIPVRSGWHDALPHEIGTHDDIKNTGNYYIHKSQSHVNTNQIKNSSTMLCHNNTEKSKIRITEYGMVDLRDDMGYLEAQLPQLEIESLDPDSLGSLQKYRGYHLDKVDDKRILPTCRGIDNSEMFNVTAMSFLQTIHEATQQAITLYTLQHISKQSSVKSITDHMHLHLLTIIGEHIKNQGKNCDVDYIDNKLLENLIYSLSIQEIIYYNKKYLIKSTNEILLSASLLKTYKEVNPTTSQMVQNPVQITFDSAYKTSKSIPNLVYEKKKVPYRTKKKPNLPRDVSRVQSVTGELKQQRKVEDMYLQNIGKIQLISSRKRLFDSERLHTNKAKEIPGKNSKGAKERVNAWIKEWPNKSPNEWTKEWPNEWTEEWLNEWEEEWIKEWTKLWGGKWAKIKEWAKWERIWPNECQWNHKLADIWANKWAKVLANKWAKEIKKKWPKVSTKKTKTWTNIWIRTWMKYWGKVWMETEKAISLDKDSPKATMPEMNTVPQVNESIYTKCEPFSKSSVVRQTEVPKSLKYVEVSALDTSNDDQSKNPSLCSNYTPLPSPVDRSVEPLKQSEYTLPERANCNQPAQSSLPDFTNQTTVPCMETNLQKREEETTDTIATLEEGDINTEIQSHDVPTGTSEEMNGNKTSESKRYAISEIKLCQVLQAHTNVNTSCDTSSSTAGQSQDVRCSVEVPDGDKPQCLVKVLQPCATLKQKHTVHICMVCNVQQYQDQQPSCTNITGHLQEQKLEKLNTKMLQSKQVSIVLHLQPTATCQATSTQHHSGSNTNLSAKMCYQLEVWEESVQSQDSLIVQSLSSSQSNTQCSLMMQVTCCIHKALKHNVQHHISCGEVISLDIQEDNATALINVATADDHLDDTATDLAATPADHHVDASDSTGLMAPPADHIDDIVNNSDFVATTVDDLVDTSDNINLAVNHLDDTAYNADPAVTPIDHLVDTCGNIDLETTSMDYDIADNADSTAPTVIVRSNSSDNADNAATASVRLSVPGLPSNIPSNDTDSFIQDTEQYRAQNTESNIAQKCKESSYPYRNIQLIPEVIEHDQSLHGKATNHHMINDPCDIATGYKGCCAYGSFFHGNKLCPTKMLLRFLYMSTKFSPFSGLQQCVNCGLRSTVLHKTAKKQDQFISLKKDTKVYWIPQPAANFIQSCHIFHYPILLPYYSSHVVHETTTNNPQSPQTTNSCYYVAKCNKVLPVCTSLNVLGNIQSILKYISCIPSDIASMCKVLTINSQEQEIENSKPKSLKIGSETQVTYQRRTYEAINNDPGPDSNSDNCEKETHEQQDVTRCRINIVNVHKTDLTDDNTKPILTTFDFNTITSKYALLQNQLLHGKARNDCILCKQTDEVYCGCKILNYIKKYTHNFPDGNPPSKPPPKTPPQFSSNHQVKGSKHPETPTNDLPVRPQQYTVRCGKAKLQRYSTLKDYSDYRGIPPKITMMPQNVSPLVSQ